MLTGGFQGPRRVATAKTTKRTAIQRTTKESNKRTLLIARIVPVATLYVYRHIFGVTIVSTACALLVGEKGPQKDEKSTQPQ